MNPNQWSVGKLFFFPICIFFPWSHMVEFVRWVHLDGEASRGSIATSLAQPHHVWASGVSAAAGGVAPYLVCCATAGRGQAWLGFFALGWWGGGHFEKKDSNWHGSKLCARRWSFLSWFAWFHLESGVMGLWRMELLFSLWKRVVEMDCILFLGKIRLAARSHQLCANLLWDF